MNQQPLQTPPENIPPVEPQPPVQPIQPESPSVAQAAQPPIQPAPPVVEPPTQPIQPVPSQDPSIGFQPTGIQPAPEGKSKSWILIVILLIILIVGGLIFASWQGWIKLGGIEKYWKKPVTTTPAPVPVPTPKENDQTRKSDLKNIKDALKKYYQANQSYPVATVVQKTSDLNNTLEVLVPSYIVKLPADPLSPNYFYGYTSDGKTFEITARLEDITDPLAIKVGENLYIYKVTDTSTETPGVTTK